MRQYRATTVLPEPTSPCSRRRIGASRRRSASSSSSASSWCAVSSKGRPSRKARLRSPGAGRAGALYELLLFLLVEQEPDLHQQQLFEHQALAGQLRLRERARQVHGHDRVGAAGQSLAHEQSRRQRIRQQAHGRRDGVHDAAQELRRDLLAGRVHGDHSFGVHPFPALVIQDLVALDREGLASALRPERAAQAESHALLQHPGQVALVEPHGLDRAGVVAHQHAHDVDPAPGRAVRADAHDLTADGGLFTDLEVADAPCGRGSPRSGAGSAR